MKRSMSRVSAFVLGLPLLGCAAEQHQAPLSLPCGAAETRRQALVARRASLLADMKRDVELGQGGGVPGRSFDDQSSRNADAYVRRLKANWSAADRALGDDIREIDRQSREAGCHAT